MSHVVLLGDSIFDNASYVPGSPAVIDQLRKQLPSGWRATLLAVDGDCIRHVPDYQLKKLPADATHLAISAGGNDALGHSGLLRESTMTMFEFLGQLVEAQRDFRREYQRMLEAVLAQGKPTVVCTVYDSVPGLEAAAATALSVFNDCIVREAFSAGLPLIDIRLVCDEPGDYAPISPIEPSVHGGEKIAAAIAKTLSTHNFGLQRTSVYF